MIEKRVHPRPGSQNWFRMHRPGATNRTRPLCASVRHPPSISSPLLRRCCARARFALRQHPAAGRLAPRPLSLSLSPLPPPFASAVPTPLGHPERQRLAGQSSRFQGPPAGRRPSLPPRIDSEQTVTPQGTGGLWGRLKTSIPVPAQGYLEIGGLGPCAATTWTGPARAGQGRAATTSRDHRRQPRGAAHGGQYATRLPGGKTHDSMHDDGEEVAFCPGGRSSSSKAVCGFPVRASPPRPVWTAGPEAASLKVCRAIAPTLQ
ncbi:hypothetical protein B0T11DRAFT_102366 [Plectosphaerella cucumerina]|uniref:Uncharacterized protein n=1 Tax=Plectosphaerella cucumerina TaxID=40658 RepID=A0A8K0X150_9PEZI|nr:hypothetical protein B0T11DRAFT_102366 [Plectosphaerella cucumerina]